MILSLGIAVFKLSGLGCDPFNGMNMQVSSLLPISYADFQVMVNAGIFIIQMIGARNMIGPGTIFNAFINGYIVTIFYDFMNEIVVNENMVFRLVLMFLGVVVCSLGLSIYQATDTGVSPLDSMPFCMEHLMPQIPYSVRRIVIDGFCAFVCLITGGISAGNLGIGTLICVLGFGPLIQLFNHTFVDKLVN